MKLYSVEIRTVVVVAGEDESDAHFRAEEDKREIKNDEDMDVTVLEEVDADTLPDGWDSDCIPYGGDGNTRIGEMGA
jgi:hypothetical protein